MTNLSSPYLSSSRIHISLLIVSALLYCVPLKAATPHLAQPVRTEASIEGRDEVYNDVRLLNQLSFRQLEPMRAATEEGVWGSGGSVSSSRLHYDFRFFNDFAFNQDANGFLLDVQRGADFDGEFERQLVGFRHNVDKDTALSLQGDVYSDKSQIDLYFSAQHRFNAQHSLKGSLILPDAYFNGKTKTENRYTHDPQSYFLQWHRQGQALESSTLLSLTLSPHARFNSVESELRVASKSALLGLSHTQGLRDWTLLFELKGEATRRDYNLLAASEGRQTEFERNYGEISLALRDEQHPLRATWGLAYLFLRELGYTGRRLDDEARVIRQEPIAFVTLHHTISETTELRPTVYLSYPKIKQDFTRHPDLNAHHFTGKLALPFIMRFSGTEDAHIVLNPTFYLHKFAFGGGNVQVLWPL